LPGSGVALDTLKPAPSPPTHLRHPVVLYAGRRVVAGAMTLLVVSMLVFLACQVVPGDAASMILGRQATGPQLQHLRLQMGLEHPLVERYWTWVTDLAQGNLGYSAEGYAAGGRVSVWSLIEPRLWNTLLLAGLAFAFAVPISIALGTAAAVREAKATDHVITVVTLTLVSLPEFVLGAVLIVVFFSWLDVLPPVALFSPGVSPLTDPRALVLPVLTLLGVTVGAAARMVRAGVIETLRSDYVQTARLQGIPEHRVRLRYALRNALAPSVQVLAQVLQYLIGGIVVVEYLFAYPGLGASLVTAVGVRDVFEIEAITMIFAAGYILINIVADLLVIGLVPKLRTTV
jgi:peptide/nickel transport system permease protein